MTLLTSPAAARRLRGLRQAALVAVSLFLAHEVTYLVRSGDAAGTATLDAAAGHGYWPAFMLVAALSLASLAAQAAWRLTIGARRRATQPEPVSLTPAPTTYRAEWRRLAGRLAPLVVALFLLQENLEHLLAHGHVEGLAVYLGDGSWLALPAVLLVVGTVAAAGALVRWRETTLVHRLRAALRDRRPITAAAIPAARWGIAAALLRRLLWLGDDLRGRAPPRLLPA